MELALEEEGFNIGFDLDHESERPTLYTGWAHTGLGTVQIHVVDGARTHRFSPTTLQAAVAADSLRLGTCLGPSDISRQPAYLYRTHELQILLTKGEISRLVLHRLSSAEVLKLRKRFGTFFEIDEDFYDKVTGEALG